MKPPLPALLLLVALPSAAQVPEGWHRERPLGSEAPEGGLWLGAGTWVATKTGPPAVLVDSLGLGNAITGAGFTLEAGYRGKSLDAAAQLRLQRFEDGGARAKLFRGHLSYATSGGWRWSLEKEPLVWGYGLNGGYLLGEAAEPFPRLRMETPATYLGIGKLPLGCWRGQVLLGRLENHRGVADGIQDPSWRGRMIRQGEPEQPMLSGFRLEATFGDMTELYLNYLNLFGGTFQGRAMTQGYSLGEFFTAAFGLKDAFAEGNVDFQNPQRPGGTYVNDARSASNSDVGVRVRLPFLEAWSGARDVRLYISRGSKAVNFQQGVLIHKPLYYIGKDLEKDGRYLARLGLSSVWNTRTRYLLPCPDVPNDTVGLLFRWEGLRLGLEYLDSANRRDQDGRPVEGGHRSFTHGIYRAGFYTRGDALGMPFGGEVRLSTLRLEYPLAGGLEAFTLLHMGNRPYRDVTTLWLQDHPGATPDTNRLLGLQQGLVFRRPGFQARGGFALQRHGAVLNISGRSETGSRAFLELGWTWNGKKTSS